MTEAHRDTPLSRDMADAMIGQVVHIAKSLKVFQGRQGIEPVSVSTEDGTVLSNVKRLRTALNTAQRDRRQTLGQAGYIEEADRALRDAEECGE